MILVIDNYDSFVYNLARYLEEVGEQPVIYRHDAITLDAIYDMRPSAIVLSPGPCGPQQAGVCLDAVKAFYTSIPILGVCLGHQVIGEAFGGVVSKAARPQHGKVSHIRHDGRGIFKDIENPLKVGRYHSLIVENEGLPHDLVVQATTSQGEIMAICHRTYPVVGVQFHPESILTSSGHRLIQNFLAFRVQADIGE